MTESSIDPRAASDEIRSAGLDGADLVGEEIVRLELVDVGGVGVGVPALLPGAAEWATVTAAEANADRLRHEALDNLDGRGAIPTADINAAIRFRLNAGTAVASAGIGLEACASYHIERALLSEKAAEAVQRPLNERYSEELPAIFEVASPTDEEWWPGLRRIQGLAALQRHGVEGQRRKSGLAGEKTLNQRLYDREHVGAADTMLSAFTHFTPTWLDEERRARLLALSGA